MYPEHVCFSPTNWRNISVAYKNEIHLWNLEICDPQRVKTNKTRLRMPLSNKGSESAIKESALSRLKDEFELGHGHAMAIFETFKGITE